MTSRRRLSRAFYARPSTVVAPELLGRVLVRRTNDGSRLAARIVEVEAYAPDDPASHAFRGPTPRNAAMFGPAGRLYVYLAYGVHHCMNAVTGRVGEGSAVLLRAAEPLEGISVMRERRGRDAPSDLCSGPGKLCQAFGVDRSMDDTDLILGNELSIVEGDPVDRRRVVASPRVGIGVGADRLWRFSVRDDPWVSHRRPVPRSSPG